MLGGKGDPEFVERYRDAIGKLLKKTALYCDDRGQHCSKYVISVYAAAIMEIQKIDLQMKDEKILEKLSVVLSHFFQ